MWQIIKNKLFNWTIAKLSICTFTIYHTIINTISWQVTFLSFFWHSFTSRPIFLIFSWAISQSRVPTISVQSASKISHLWECRHYSMSMHLCVKASFATKRRKEVRAQIKWEKPPFQSRRLRLQARRFDKAMRWFTWCMHLIFDRLS